MLVLDIHKHCGEDEQTRAPVAATVDVEVLQLVIDAAVSDVYILEETIAELETEKATMQDEVREMYNSLSFVHSLFHCSIPMIFFKISI